MPLERLRAVKRADELTLIREASEKVIAAMLATFAQMHPGMTKRDVSDMLRDEEHARGLSFDYCLITAGTGFNRAPSRQVIAAGDIISLDSGGSYERLFRRPVPNGHHGRSGPGAGGFARRDRGGAAGGSHRHPAGRAGAGDFCRGAGFAWPGRRTGATRSSSRMAWASSGTKRHD